MTVAAATRGAKLYQNNDLKREIIGALEWLDQNRYNPKTASYSNWWHLEIGAPLRINNIAVLLYDDLSAEQRGRLMAAVKHFNPNFQRYADLKDQATGANLVWKCTIQIVRGIVLKDAAEIRAGRDNLSDLNHDGAASVFREVTSGDGFYRDGSFIQHLKHPYTGGYGKSFLGNIADIIYLLADSSLRIRDSEHKNLYGWIENAFLPLVWRGAMMDMTRGREISRPATQDHVAGHAVVRGVLRASQFAPEPEAARLRAAVKALIAADTFRNFYEFASLEMIANAKRLMRDRSIKPEAPNRASKIYAAMDRVVHRRPNFAFGIAMSSARTFKYESINHENLRGWFTSDGATYFYNDDSAQFSEDFWATVDAHRLPGTTVDTVKREPISVAYLKEFVPRNRFAGGAALGDFAVAGMELSAENTDLTARKSWFLFDDAIVCLGAGITSRSSRTIETTVDNRRLSNAGRETLTIGASGEKTSEGAIFAADFNAQQTIKNAVWAHLAGIRGARGIGYYFPAAIKLNVLRDRRTDAWTSVNAYTPNPEKHSRNYLTAWLDHGANPTGAVYAYVLLPNRTAAETGDYADDPRVRIVENSESAQAVEGIDLRIFAVNFWTNKMKTVGAVTCDRPASVLLREKNGSLEIAVSDPTQTGDSINLIVDRAAFKNLKLRAADKNIRVAQTAEQIELTVDVRAALGKTFVAQFARRGAKANK